MAMGIRLKWNGNMLIRKLCFIFIVVSMLTILVVRPVHQDKKTNIEDPVKKVVRMSPTEVKTNVIVDPLLGAKTGFPGS